jgi:hypothetical protein
VPTHIIHFVGIDFIAKERCRRSSLIKHQNSKFVLQHWHFLILDPAATFIGWYFSFVAKALALTFPSTAQKSVMPYFYKAFAKYARKTAV